MKLEQKFKRDERVLVLSQEAIYRNSIFEDGKEVGARVTVLQPIDKHHRIFWAVVPIEWVHSMGS